MKPKYLKKKILSRPLTLGVTAFGSVGTIGATVLACSTDVTNRSSVAASDWLHGEFVNYVISGTGADVTVQGAPTGAHYLFSVNNAAFSREIPRGLRDNQVVRVMLEPEPEFTVTGVNSMIMAINFDRTIIATADFLQPDNFTFIGTSGTGIIRPKVEPVNGVEYRATYNGQTQPLGAVTDLIDGQVIAVSLVVSDPDIGGGRGAWDEYALDNPSATVQLTVDLTPSEPEVTIIENGDYLVESNFDFAGTDGSGTVVALETPEGTRYEATYSGQTHPLNEINDLQSGQMINIRMVVTNAIEYALADPDRSLSMPVPLLPQVINTSQYLQISNFTFIGNDGSGTISAFATPTGASYQVTHNGVPRAINAINTLRTGEALIISLVITDPTGYQLDNPDATLHITVGSLQPEVVTIPTTDFLRADNFTFAGTSGNGTITAIRTPVGATYQTTRNGGTTTALTALTGLTDGETLTITLLVTDPTRYQLDDPDQSVSLAFAPTRSVVLSNFDMTSNLVKPPAPSPAIDYNARQFRQGFDDGFNWQQFLDSPANGGDGIGDAVINQAMADTDLINLGFITAANPALVDANNAEVERLVLPPFLDFINANPNLTIPAIGGALPLWMTNWTDGLNAATPDQHQAGSPVYQFLTQLRNAGKDYVFSFGGQDHDSLAMDALLKGYSASELRDLYAAIIDALDLRVIDFDIEGTESGTTDAHTVQEGIAAKNLRMQALTLLKNDPKYQNLHISFTMPTPIDGLRSDDLQLVVQALKTGVIDYVNIKAFNFGLLPLRIDFTDSAARNTVSGEAAFYAMAATNKLANDLVTNDAAASLPEAYGKIGVTNMIGVQDTETEVWTLTDQEIFTNFAINKGLRNLSFSETTSDMEQLLRGTVTGASHDFGLWDHSEIVSGARAKDPFSSGLNVANFAFTDIAKRFNTGQLYDFNGHDLEHLFIPKFLFAMNERGIATFDVYDETFRAARATLPQIAAFADIDFFFNNLDEAKALNNILLGTESHTSLLYEINIQWPNKYLTRAV